MTKNSTKLKTKKETTNKRETKEGENLRKKRNKTTWNTGKRKEKDITKCRKEESKKRILKVAVNTADLAESTTPVDRGRKTEYVTSRDSKCESHFVRRASNFNTGHRSGGPTRDSSNSYIFENISYNRKYSLNYLRVLWYTSEIFWFSSATTHSLEIYKVLVGKPWERGHYGDPGVDGRLMLIWTLKEKNGKVWTGLIWIQTGTDSGLLWTR